VSTLFADARLREKCPVAAHHENSNWWGDGDGSIFGCANLGINEHFQALYQAMLYNKQWIVPDRPVYFTVGSQGDEGCQSPILTGSGAAHSTRFDNDFLFSGATQVTDNDDGRYSLVQPKKDDLKTPLVFAKCIKCGRIQLSETTQHLLIRRDRLRLKSIRYLGETASTSDSRFSGLNEVEVPIPVKSSNRKSSITHTIYLAGSGQVLSVASNGSEGAIDRNSQHLLRSVNGNACSVQSARHEQHTQNDDAFKYMRFRTLGPVFDSVDSDGAIFFNLSNRDIDVSRDGTHWLHLSVCIASDIYRITGPGAGWLAALASASLRRFNFLRFIAR
jgi:hypothetical protein